MQPLKCIIARLEEIKVEQNMGDITNYFTESPDAFMRSATKASSNDGERSAKASIIIEVMANNS